MNEEEKSHLVGDILAHTFAAPMVRRFRAARVAERAEIERIRGKLRPLLGPIREAHADLLIPAWC